MLTLHPANNSSPMQASPAASRVLNLFFPPRLSASAVMPRSPSKAGNCGGNLPGPSGSAVDFAVVTMLIVTCEVAVTDAGLKLHVDKAGRPLQAKVIAPRLPLFAV